MIALEITALMLMAIVFVTTFIRSAQSHTRAAAWNAPPAVTPLRPVKTLAVAPAPAPERIADGVVIDAAVRFDARRVRTFVEDVAEQAA